MVERATVVEWGLQAAKARQAETKAMLWKSLADTEAALQRALETLDTEWKAMESERKAWSEADQEVLVLRGLEANAWLREPMTR